MSAILSLLNTENYQVYNRDVAKWLGSVLASIMLSELIQRFQFHQKTKSLITLSSEKGQWFYYTVDLCNERTGLTRDNQETALEIIIKLGLVTKVKAGTPAKRHFQINVSAIEKWLNSKIKINTRESTELVRGKAPNKNEGKHRTIKEPYKNPKIDCIESDPAEAEKKETIQPFLSSIKILDHNKKETHLTKNDIHFINCKFNYQWSSEEVEFLWQQLSNNSRAISNLEKYLETIIKNRRLTANITKQKDNTSCNSPQKKKSSNQNENNKSNSDKSALENIKVTISGGDMKKPVYLDSWATLQRSKKLPNG